MHRLFDNAALLRQSLRPRAPVHMIFFNKPLTLAQHTLNQNGLATTTTAATTTTTTTTTAASASGSTVPASRAYRYFSTHSTLLSSSSKYTKPIARRVIKRKPFRAFLLITIGALLFISIKDYQQTDFSHPEIDTHLVRPTSWPLYLYSYLPLNTVSRLWGGFNSITLPTPLRAPGYKLYSFLFGVNLDEMKDPVLSHYKNLSEFFYREIRPETRPIDPAALLVSPSDGTVLNFGKVNQDGTIDQVKGMTYKLEALLGEAESQKISHSKSVKFSNDINTTNHTHPSSLDDIESNFLSHLQNNTNKDCTASGFSSSTQQSLVNFEQDGEKSVFHPSTAKVLKATTALAATPSSSLGETDLFYTVIYLAPGDYHRFHSPVTWVSTLRRHFVGELYSVAPYFQNTFNNLFVLNERVALLGYWKHGFFSMTPVGATNVGSIKINFDKDLTTNTRMHNGVKTKKNTCYEAHYTEASSLLKGQPIFKGEEVGGFMLGSTVVLVFEAPKNFKFNLEQGQKVKMGQPIGDIEE